MIFCDEADYADTDQIEGDFTDVVAIEPVQGGWMVFKDARDLEVWNAQQ